MQLFGNDCAPATSICTISIYICTYCVSERVFVCKCVCVCRESIAFWMRFICYWCVDPTQGKIIYTFSVLSTFLMQTIICDKIMHLIHIRAIAIHRNRITLTAMHTSLVHATKMHLIKAKNAHRIYSQLTKKDRNMECQIISIMPICVGVKRCT